DNYVWLAGRWIYDCGHVPPSGMAYSELHPCMAMATVWREGVYFSDGHARPAVRFSFFASRFGGHRDSPVSGDAWGGRDFHFLVHLPPRPSQPAPHPIRAADANAQPPQQVVPRPAPQLIVQASADAYATARGNVGPAGGGPLRQWEFSTSGGDFGNA